MNVISLMCFVMLIVIDLFDGVWDIGEIYWLGFWNKEIRGII